MKNKFYKKKFSPKKFEKENRFQPAEQMTIGEILSNPQLDRAIVDGIIEKIAQTKGPTIFVIADGTRSLSLKGFQKPGERAYPEINEGDSVRAVVEIGEFKGETEGEIKKITILSDEEKKLMQKRIDDEIIKRAKVDEIPFLVESPILNKLRILFIKAAREIKLAVLQHRPIIVRHHNDTDGYSAGYALERAILPLIEKEQSSDKAGWEFFQRAPCSAPFYEIDDSIRDTAISLRNVAKFSNKMPLVIIADNGSSPEDLLAIKQGKVHGMEFIVIDHHYSSEDVITAEVLTHINPFLVGEDGAKFSAGMLCTELARLINLVPNIEQIPAMAGLSDRIEIANPKIIEDYLNIAKKEGYSKELLMDISTVINFVSSKIRFMEAREYMEVIFGEPREQQKKLVGLMAPYIRRLEEKGLTIAKANASSEKIGEVTLQSLDIENTFGFGFYPKPGMCVGMIHDDLQKTKNIDKLVSVGIMSTALTMRATNGANFSVHDFITLLNKKLPEAFVEGGGHKNAGSITFVPNKKEEVIQMLKNFIKSR
ncbi:hypothetical protein J4456_03105 [Candidatus Pacearchaeota archaeon]|nr:hypothetical protein [Candidatus Pacearchaeota archaeon]